ncbi:DUF4899 domain-containing protein [Dethiosulfovibrio sp. F2B]|uniref:DUF4899 domain-containing protein n=1 Tax=Dethiosulfovibrio faecalis TaxID=2720018 RepID=UPI001F1EBBB1|nr:DUF4899 domain-containing protein [Dethiosulfovibrio faecalis]MCF4152163.1 DUF4899 domain-containing protein [Dethiosulfovibrio faecalis]
MPQSSESFHETKEKIKKSVEEMRRSQLNATLEKLANRSPRVPEISTVEIWPEGDQEIDRKYVVVKCAYRTRTSGGATGLVVFLADETLGEPELLCLWTGYGGGLGEADIDASWQALTILMERIEAPQDKMLHEKTVEALKKRLSPPTVNRLATDDDEDRRRQIREDLQHELERELALSLEMKLGIEKTTGEDLGKFRESREEKREKKEEESRTRSTEIDHLTLLCGVVMDPVRGEPVSALRPGDTIYVSIKDSSAIAHALRQVMTKGNIDKIPVTLLSTETTDTGNVELMVELSDGIYGKALAGESYKISVLREDSSPRIIGLSFYQMLFALTMAGLLMIMAVHLLID